MTQDTDLSVVRVQGAPRRLGNQIGEAAAPQIHRMLANYREIIDAGRDRLKLDWGGAIQQARKYLQFCSGPYWEELQGMAEGASVALDELVVLNSIEAIVHDGLHLKCTSLALTREWTTDGHVLMAHNEDWWPDDTETLYLVHATPDDEPPFLALTYGGLLPCIGFNAAGIAQCCDSVYPSDARIGVPRLFVGRSVLGARTVSEAIDRATDPDRAAGYNHLIAEREGHLISLEVSAKRFAVIGNTDGALVHTNHYLDPEMQRFEAPPSSLHRSKARYERATELLYAGRPHSRESVGAILADHQNPPGTICCHLEDAGHPLDRIATIASVIIDLSEMTMHVARGQPCAAAFQPYML